MCRVHRHRCEQEIEFPLTVFFDKRPRARIQLVQAKNPDSLGGERRPQIFVPALILVVHKFVGFTGNNVALLNQGEAVGPGFGVPIFNLLHQPSYTHLKKFIQVASGDGKKFQPLQQGVFLVLRFFEDAAIEGEPGGFSIDVVGRTIEREA